jgi:hypothetical protein
MFICLHPPLFPADSLLQSIPQTAGINRFPTGIFIPRGMDRQPALIVVNHLQIADLIVLTIDFVQDFDILEFPIILPGILQVLPDLPEILALFRGCNP